MKNEKYKGNSSFKKKFTKFEDKRTDKDDRFEDNKVKGDGFKDNKTKDDRFKDNRSKDNKVKDDRFKNNRFKDNKSKDDRFISGKARDEIKEDEVREDIIEGRNGVIEALKSDRTIEQILVAQGDVSGSINLILALAKEKKIVVKEIERKRLDAMSVTGAHQGVIAKVTPYKYFEIEDILKYAAEKEENPFLLILDEIEDPHNFGALIRTAEVCGVHGIIIPKRRNVGMTPIVYKASSGAAEHMKVAKVTNINIAIDDLKKKGIWIYGADMDGKQYCYETNLTGPSALVIGSEGRGISKLTKEKCDVLTKIPMKGQITCLNASIAGSILMYECMKQKMVSGIK